MESSPDIVVAVDSEGTTIFYNDGARSVLGYSSEEVRGVHAAQFYPSEDEAKRVMAAMRSKDHGGEGRVKNFETEFVNKQGEHVAVAISGSIIYDEKGRELGSIGFAKDIAELRLHEQMETLGELAIGLAHEINNPLESMVNNAELLDRSLKRCMPEKDYAVEHERIAGIKKELRRIQAIVERVGEMAAAGTYGTMEYLPGRLMTDLGLNNANDVEDTDTAEPEYNLEGKTILVVDDNDEVRQTMAEVLGARGCTVITKRTGLEALDWIAEHRPDLVLSDVVMPDMDGYELFEELKRRDSQIPVVLMTAYYYDKNHVIKRSKTQGLADVIFKKPINPNRLLELIEARVGN